MHVRKLGSRAKYTFRLQSAATACEQGAAGGTDVPGWKYRRGGVLVTNRHGVANSWARARGFKVDRSVEYFVGVFDTLASGLVACAQLTKKHKAKPAEGPRRTHEAAAQAARATNEAAQGPRPRATVTGTTTSRTGNGNAERRAREG